MKTRKTIGEWIAAQNKILKAAVGYGLRNEGSWSLYRSGTGTFASVKMRVCLVNADGETIGVAYLGHQWRSGDYSHAYQWEPGSAGADEANRVARLLEGKDYSSTPVTEFVGINHALPWELLTPERPTLWQRIVHWLRGVAGRKA